MFPNLLPSLMIFGMTGWMGEPVGIGSMMTASVALGIAVDDTLHFVTWFRRGLARGQDRKQAVFYAYGRCGTAMVQTSLICGLGLWVFSFSRFVPTAHFAQLMVMLLAAALLGDRVVFPAILVSPMGRAFEPESSLMVRLFLAIRRRLSRRGDPK
jgi:predicted RND superfamily exporter protein